MMQDPDLGPEFLLPLKMQGIEEVAENALVCRVKFTTRPVNPTYVQRQALKRIHEAFKERGIEFASNAVIVQTSGATMPGGAEMAAAGAEIAQVSTRR
jgi:small-conductance mechanosensitive channel